LRLLRFARNDILEVKLSTAWYTKDTVNAYRRL
jgi:hypothetical protein